MLKESQLHKYQEVGVEHIIDNPFCGLLLEMGLGKTVTTLTAIKRLMFEELEVTRVLVIAPKRVAESVWARECKEWEHTKDFRVSYVGGNAKKRLAALATEAEVYTLGRENVPWLCGLFGGSSLPFDMVVIDESSSFKNHKSVRFKALKLVQPSIKRIVLLTGTPAPNGLLDLWAQIYLLDRGERLGKFISHFRINYFSPAKSNGDVVYSYNIRKGSEESIYDKIGDICMSMKSEDYLNLPGRMEHIIKVDFTEEVQQLYNEFEKEKVLEMFDTKDGESPEINAVNAAALSNKLLQFANGAVYDEDKNYHIVHDLKLDALEDIIEAANGKPILLAWTFRHDMYRLMERFKKLNPVQLKTDQDITDWNEGKIRLLLMHPASGGHGLNLQKGGHILVWFGQTWSLELFQQFNARLDRQGQTDVVQLYRLVASKTVEQDVVKATDRKADTQEGLMQAVKARIDKYIA